MKYKELMEEIDSKGNLDDQNRYVIHCQEIANADEFNTNLGNFDIQNDELIELIFKATNIITYQYSDCEIYNFDTISYAFLGYAFDNEAECTELMNKITSGEQLYDGTLTMIFSLVERYNDLDGSYNDGRV